MERRTAIIDRMTAAPSGGGDAQKSPRKTAAAVSPRATKAAAAPVRESVASAPAKKELAKKQPQLKERAPDECWYDGEH